MDNPHIQHRQRIDQIGRLKKEFNTIKLYNGEVNNVFDNLDTKMNKLKEIYDSFLSDNHNTLFVFGLDTFKFQNRLIDEDYETLRKYYNLICNRMYRDYYKLLQLISDFILNDDTLTKLHRMVDKNKYPKYNYLNVYKFYEVQSSADIFNEIISLINSLNDQSKSISTQIKNYNSKKKFGLNINNFIYTHAYKNSMLNEQIYLYLNYLSFFIKLHMKYFTRFVAKIKLVYSEITNDINFDNTKDNANNVSLHMNQTINNLSNNDMSSSPSPLDYYSDKDSNGSTFIERQSENLNIETSLNNDYSIEQIDSLYNNGKSFLKTHNDNEDILKNIDIQTQVEEQTDEVEQQTDEVEQQTGEVEEQTDEVEQQTDEVEEQTDEVEQQTDEVEEQTDEVEEQIADED